MFALVDYKTMEKLTNLAQLFSLFVFPFGSLTKTICHIGYVRGSDTDLPYEHNQAVTQQLCIMEQMLNVNTLCCDVPARLA